MERLCPVEDVVAVMVTAMVAAVMVRRTAAEMVKWIVVVMERAMVAAMATQTGQAPAA